MNKGDLKAAQADAADPDIKIIKGRYAGNTQDENMLSGGRRAKPETATEVAVVDEGEVRSFPRITGDSARNDTPESSALKPRLF